MRRDWSLHSTVYVRCIFLPQQELFCKSQRKWITNHISKFHDNPTVNKFGIVVLLRQFWVSAGKEKVTMQRIFLPAQTSFRNSQRWKCSKMSSKPGAQISRWFNGEWVQDCCFSEIGLVVCGKKRRFWEEEREKRNWQKEEA